MPFQMRFRMLSTLLLSLIVPAGSASADMRFNFENCYKIKTAVPPDQYRGKAVFCSYREKTGKYQRRAADQRDGECQSEGGDSMQGVW